MLTKQKLSLEALGEILGQFDLGKIENIEPLATSGNVSYVIKTNERSYFLRLCPESGPRWRSQEEIEAELEFLNYLKSNNFPIIGAVKNKSGQEIISWQNQFGYLREFLELEEKLNPNIEEIEKFGQVLGWFHLLVENYQTKNKREHIFDLTETKKHFEEAKEKILKSAFASKEKFIEEFAKEINSLNFPIDLPRGMVHEDLGKRHVLWRAEPRLGRGSEIAAIVDFDRSYFGQLIFDLGQACRGWCFINNWQEWSQENFKALILGYEKKRPLKDEEKKCLFDAIKFAVLERSLAFCLRYLEATQDEEDAEFARAGVFSQLKMINI